MLLILSERTFLRSEMNQLLLRLPPLRLLLKKLQSLRLLLKKLQSLRLLLKKVQSLRPQSLLHHSLLPLLRSSLPKVSSANVVEETAMLTKEKCANTADQKDMPENQEEEPAMIEIPIIQKITVKPMYLLALMANLRNLSLMKISKNWSATANTSVVMMMVLPHPNNTSLNPMSPSLTSLNPMSPSLTSLNPMSPSVTNLSPIIPIMDALSEERSSAKVESAGKLEPEKSCAKEVNAVRSSARLPAKTREEKTERVAEAPELEEIPERKELEEPELRLLPEEKKKGPHKRLLPEEKKKGPHGRLLRELPELKKKLPEEPLLLEELNHPDLIDLEEDPVDQKDPQDRVTDLETKIAKEMITEVDTSATEADTEADTEVETKMVDTPATKVDTTLADTLDNQLQKSTTTANAGATERI